MLRWRGEDLGAELGFVMETLGGVVGVVGAEDGAETSGMTMDGSVSTEATAGDMSISAGADLTLDDAIEDEATAVTCSEGDGVRETSSTASNAEFQRTRGSNRRSGRSRGLAIIGDTIGDAITEAAAIDLPAGIDGKVGAGRVEEEETEEDLEVDS